MRKRIFSDRRAQKTATELLRHGMVTSCSRLLEDASRSSVEVLRMLSACCCMPKRPSVPSQALKCLTSRIIQ